MDLTDKEKFELSAKAAGIEGEYTESFYCGVGIAQPPIITKYANRTVNQAVRSWNPRDDDGDALRLAVELNIKIVFDEELQITEAHYLDSKCGWIAENWWDNKNAATRLAIFNAAVEIGKDMS